MNLKLKLNHAKYFVVGLLYINYKVKVVNSSGDCRVVLAQRLMLSDITDMWDEVKSKLKKESEVWRITDIERIK